MKRWFDAGDTMSDKDHDSGKSYSDTILITLRQIIRAIELHSRDLSKKYGITGPQLLVLKELRKEPEKTIGQVSRTISLSQATVTSILDRLEKQGLVTRVRSQSDKRKVCIQLSNRALEILDATPNPLQEEFTDQFESLAEWEKLSLISSLYRIAGMMNADRLNSPPVLSPGNLDASHNELGDYLDYDGD